MRHGVLELSGLCSRGGGGDAPPPPPQLPPPHQRVDDVLHDVVEAGAQAAACRDKGTLSVESQSCVGLTSPNQQ